MEYLNVNGDSGLTTSSVTPTAVTTTTALNRALLVEGDGSYHHPSHPLLHQIQPHHINVNHHHSSNTLAPLLLGHHHSPYSNNYPLHNHHVVGVGLGLNGSQSSHSHSHSHLHSEQTKSLQELQHEVGALLEFRDLVIETFPDLKHKMASISSSTSSNAAPLSGAHHLAGGNSSLALASRWVRNLPYAPF